MFVLGTKRLWLLEMKVDRHNYKTGLLALVELFNRPCLKKRAGIVRKVLPCPTQLRRFLSTFCASLMGQKKDVAQRMWPAVWHAICPAA